MRRQHAGFQSGAVYQWQVRLAVNLSDVAAEVLVAVVAGVLAMDGRVLSSAAAYVKSRCDLNDS